MTKQLKSFRQPNKVRRLPYFRLSGRVLTQDNHHSPILSVVVAISTFHVVVAASDNVVIIVAVDDTDITKTILEPL